MSLHHGLHFFVLHFSIFVIDNFMNHLSQCLPFHSLSPVLFLSHFSLSLSNPHASFFKPSLCRLSHLNLILLVLYAQPEQTPFPVFLPCTQPTQWPFSAAHNSLLMKICKSSADIIATHTCLSCNVFPLNISTIPHFYQVSDSIHIQYLSS